MEYIEANNSIGEQTPQGTASIVQSETSRRKFNHLKGLSMVLIGAVLWGVSGTAAQLLFQRFNFNSGWLVTVRMSIAGLLLLLSVSIKSGPAYTIAIWKNKRDAMKLILFAIIGLLGVQYSYFTAIQYGNAATGTILQYMGPIFITVYVALRRRQLPSLVQLASVFLALFGAFLLVTDGDLHSFAISPLAVFWGLISAVTVAFYSLYPNELLQKYGAATISGWGMLIGGIGMGFIHPPWHFTGHNTFSSWMLAGFVVLFGTLIAFYIYIASLNYISASEASVLACGEPLSATLIAVSCLHVHIGFFALLGGLCILITVTLMAWKGSTE